MAVATDRDAVEKLVQQIRAITATEPPILSVDTQIRLGLILAARHRKQALEVARDAVSLLFTLADPATRGEFGVRLTEVLRQFDPEEARRFMLSVEPRRTSGIYRDFQAEALDIVVRYWIPRDRKRAVEVFSEGIGAGAFRAESARELMEVLSTEDPPATRGLFAMLLAGFPEEGATDRDCLLLLRRATQIAPADAALAGEAARKVLAALASKQFLDDPDWTIRGQYNVGGNTMKAESARQAIRLEAAGLLAALGQETYNPYAERLSLDWPSARTITVDLDLKLSRRSPAVREDLPLDAVMLQQPAQVAITERAQAVIGESVEAALERVRRENAADSRALALVELAMRRDATPAERSKIASEALDEAEKASTLYSRLWVYEGLLPYLWEHGEHPLAIRAGQAMARVAGRFCKCEDRACSSLKDRSDCLSVNQRVAEDLFNFEISPEDLGIEDPGLRARNLLLRLKEMGLPGTSRN